MQIGKPRAILKEWDVICKFLGNGIQKVLVRKGGIHERTFVPEYDTFFLFPTWEHQNADAIRDEWREEFKKLSEPEPENGLVPIRYIARIEAVKKVEDEKLLEKFEEFHVYTPQEILSRFRRYKKSFLWFVLPRVWEIEKFELPHDEFVGCASFYEIPSEILEKIEIKIKKPAIPDDEFEKIKERFLSL